MAEPKAPSADASTPPIADDIVVTAKKQKIPHYSSGGLSTTDLVAGAVGIVTGSHGIISTVAQWGASEFFDGTRRGDLTPDMAQRVLNYKNVEAQSGAGKSRLFNLASGAAEERVAGMAVSALPGGAIISGVALGVGRGVADEEKFKSEHKKLIASMAEQGVPGYEHQTITVKGRSEEIYVDASGTAQYSSAIPVVYRPSGSESKDTAGNLRDKAASDVQEFIQNHNALNSSDSHTDLKEERQLGVKAYTDSLNDKINAAQPVKPSTLDSASQIASSNTVAGSPQQQMAMP